MMEIRVKRKHLGGTCASCRNGMDLYFSIHQEQSKRHIFYSGKEIELKRIYVLVYIIDFMQAGDSPNHMSLSTILSSLPPLIINTIIVDDNRAIQRRITPF